MEEQSASKQIDEIIKNHGGWKKEILASVRSAIKAADPGITEEVKWKTRSRPEGLPVWYHDGIVCLAETWKDNIKLIFVKGAQMKELQKHFNSRLNSSTDRAIEYREGDKVDDAVIGQMVNEAVRLNTL